MKSTNLPSMQTAQAYGCQRVDEFVDAEKRKNDSVCPLEKNMA